MLRKAGDTDAGGNLNALVELEEGSPAGFHQFPGHGLKLLGATCLRHQHHEFITPLAAEQVALADHVAEAIGNYLQYPIADAVTKTVINGLEAVEIELKQADGMAVAFCQG